MDYIELGPWGSALRSLRSQRPPLARKGSRAQAYGAGLEQAEQLWRASQNVGPEARPLLLFYGLTQAGRALCAAGVPGGAWEAPAQHGLRFELSAPPQGRVLELGSVRIHPHGQGLVQSVAGILGSPVLSCSVRMGELLSCLDSELYFDDADFLQARPLEVHQVEVFRNLPPVLRRRLFLGPVPTALVGQRDDVPAGPHNLAHTGVAAPSSEAIVRWLSAYPALARLGVPSLIETPEPSRGRIDGAEWAIGLEWPADPALQALSQSEWTRQQLDVIYGDTGGSVYGAVLPALGANQQPQALLVTWWLVLYGLSMLSRYYPRVWTDLLDVDRSTRAVPLEHLVDVATSKVPELIYAAVAGLNSLDQHQGEDSA